MNIDLLSEEYKKLQIYNSEIQGEIRENPIDLENMRGLLKGRTHIKKNIEFYKKN